MYVGGSKVIVAYYQVYFNKTPFYICLTTSVLENGFIPRENTSGVHNLLVVDCQRVLNYYNLRLYTYGTRYFLKPPVSVYEDINLQSLYGLHTSNEAPCIQLWRVSKVVLIMLYSYYVILHTITNVQSNYNVFKTRFGKTYNDGIYDVVDDGRFFSFIKDSKKDIGGNNEKIKMVSLGKMVHTRRKTNRTSQTSRQLQINPKTQRRRCPQFFTPPPPLVETKTDDIVQQTLLPCVPFDSWPVGGRVTTDYQKTTILTNAFLTKRRDGGLKFGKTRQVEKTRITLRSEVTYQSIKQYLPWTSSNRFGYSDTGT